jgi:hypothetical protein
VIHTLVSIEELADGWLAECLQCDRLVKVSRPALDEGRDDFETVLRVGACDELGFSVPHSWSSRLDRRVFMTAAVAVQEADS